MPEYKLIILDCDGTLVDTEDFYSFQKSQILTKAGLSGYTPVKCKADFAGQAFENIRQVALAENGTLLPDNLKEIVLAAAATELEKYIKPVPGASIFVESIAQTFSRFAIGSNGERPIVLKSLEVTKLMQYFSEQTIFTADQVAKPKPAPDLLFHVANSMGGVDVSDCLLIEDSVPGVLAGVAAKVDVFGITAVADGDKTLVAKELLDAGAKKVFDSYPEMYEHIMTPR